MKKLLIIAGEASGDMHGANLMKEIKNINPDTEIYGIGGDRMIAVGMTPLYHIKRMAFLGFAEVIRHLPFIKKVQYEIIEKVKKEKIETAVLIDYPGFNLDIAKKLNKLGVKIYYYISPQVWAWGKKRVKKIKKLVDKMIVVFPFEKKFYSQFNVDAEYVGHPIVEQLDNYNFLSKEEFLKNASLNTNKEILLLMPGSRKHEIKKIFPECIKAAKQLADEFNFQIVVACAENIDERIFSRLTNETNFKIIKGNTYDLLKHSYFGIIKSGTSTLEAGLLQLPFIVVYSSSYITYWLGKMLVKIKNIAMANIILEENVVEELIQNDVNANKIYSTCKKIISDNTLYISTKEKLGRIKNIIGGYGASRTAANIIMNG